MQAPLALIFSTVWPEPNSSAAGVRQMQWVQLFLSMGYQVTIASPSKLKNENDWGVLKLPEGVNAWSVELNREAIKEELKKLSPEIVMFDRFILEEQFGPQIYESCPEALILLETQDLHFVRRARDEVKEKFLTLDSLPNDFYQTETALRETSSILRVDHSFVVSSFEEKLLIDHFKIDHNKVTWVPFFYDEPMVPGAHLNFHERSGFVWIGNFRHGPNLDGLRWFRNEIWPLIRAQLPDARMKVYGAYPPEEVMAWNNIKNGLEVKGSAETLVEVFSNARVNVAPLRFGAGVKGKIMEGFRHGVPCVTTKIGTEGLFAGIEANDVQSFADACVKLHQDEFLWDEEFLMAKIKMSEVCSAGQQVPVIKKLIEQLLSKKRSQVLPDWISRVLRFEGNQSRYYFAKWIEAKEKQNK